MRLSVCLFVYVCMCVCLCSRPAGHSSRAIFAKLHTHVGPRPREDGLDFQGRGVKGEGQTVTKMEILSTR